MGALHKAWQARSAGLWPGYGLVCFIRKGEVSFLEACRSRDSTLVDLGYDTGVCQVCMLRYGFNCCVWL